MILYEYRCFECEAKFQKFLSLKHRSEIECPSCKSNKVEKLWATISNTKQKNFSACNSNCSRCNGCGN